MKTKKLLIPFPQPMVKGTFVKREKRFLAHMILEDGTATIAHCPNTGSMRTCMAPGAPTLMWDSQNPERKYPLSWKAIEIDNTWIGVDTALPNRLAELSIAGGLIDELKVYGTIAREKVIAPRTRIDLVLSSPGLPTCYVEVKNVTLVEERVARFPDAVTTRGLKHLHELTRKVDGGERAAMVYVIQRNDAEAFRPADDIDPEYGEGLREAVNKGVEVYVINARVSVEGVEAVGLLEVRL